MSDTLIDIIGIFMAIILMFIFPITEVAGKNDEISQTVVQVAVSEFANTVATKGKITRFDYEKLEHKLYSTGNSYDIQIEVQILDENPRRTTIAKSSIPESSIPESSIPIQTHRYYSIYTTDIKNKLYDETSPRDYLLKEDDYIIVSVKNTNITIATQLKNMFYKLIGKDSYTIGASATATVLNMGTI